VNTSNVTVDGLGTVIVKDMGEPLDGLGNGGKIWS